MISADASELHTRLAQRIIHIRNKEVALFTDQLGTLAQTATFLASLGYGALTMSTNFLGRERETGRYCSELRGCSHVLSTGEGFLFDNWTIIASFFTLASLGVALNFGCVRLALIHI